MFEESLTILVIGMTTVVVFLVLLVLTIQAMGLFVARLAPPGECPEPDDSPTPLPSAEALAVAVAAAKRESLSTAQSRGENQPATKKN